MICTVTPISNSKQVENYYTRDDYYSRNAKHDDFWQGKLSKKFDLFQKSVHKNHFAAFIDFKKTEKNRLWVSILLFPARSRSLFCKLFRQNTEKL